MDFAGATNRVEQNIPAYLLQCTHECTAVIAEPYKRQRRTNLYIRKQTTNMVVKITGRKKGANPSLSFETSDDNSPLYLSYTSSTDRRDKCTN